MESAIFKRHINIPQEVVRKWQDLADTLAEVIDVPAVLINRAEPPYIKILCSNKSDKNPFKTGASELVADHYSEAVLTTGRKLLITDARRNKGWIRNQDLKLGFISYLGLPIFWPDGEVFGVFCVLDTKENDYGATHEKLMSQFNELVQAHIAMLYEDRRLQLIFESLGDINAGLHAVTENRMDGIITANLNGHITFWNRGAEALYGYSSAEACTKPLTLIVSERFRDTYHREINKVTSLAPSNLERKVFHWTGLRKDGIEFPIELIHTPWRRGEEIIFTAVVHNESERRVLGELLQQRNRELATLNRVSQAISQSIKLDELLTNILDLIFELFDLSAGGIYLRDEATGELVLAIDRGLSNDIKKAVKKMGTGVVCFHGETETVEGIAGVGTSKREQAITTTKLPASSGKVQYVLTLPLNSRGRQLGMIALVIENQDGFLAEHIQLLETITSQVGIAIENAHLFEKTSRLSITDELTGLYNRRKFNELLQSEITRSERYGGPLALAILDLDGFKQYNDRFGHPSGDSLLNLFSQILKSSLRKTDLSFRYGGDEFTIILPATNARRARRTVARFESKWQQLIREQHRIVRASIGFSAGIAQFPENAETADVLVLLADAALYHSKRRGKNKCTIVSEIGKTESDLQGTTTLDRINALLSMADSKVPHTSEHASKVANIAEMIGKVLGLPQDNLAELKVAALLHDIGKVGTSESVPTGTDNAAHGQWSYIGKDIREGVRMAEYLLGGTAAIPMIMHQHEWYDGTGRPDKLKGGGIPLGSRIIAVADAYSNVISEYRDTSGLPHRKALTEVKRRVGTQFDGQIVQALYEVTKQMTSDI